MDFLLGLLCFLGFEPGPPTPVFVCGACDHREPSDIDLARSRCPMCGASAVKPSAKARAA